MMIRVGLFVVALTVLLGCTGARGSREDGARREAARAEEVAAAVVAPTVSPEFDIGTPTFGPTFQDDSGPPAVAFDGDATWLVVWRSTMLGHVCFRAQRLDESGASLDPGGIVIDVHTGSAVRPAVASDGTGWLVTWPSAAGIAGTRIGADGTLLDATPFDITTESGDQLAPAVTFDGTNYVVVWEDLRSDVDGADIYGARVSPTGTVLDPAGIAIASSTADLRQPALTHDGTNTLIVYRQGLFGSNTAIYGARVDGNGTALDPAGFLISDAALDQTTPTVQHLGQSSLVVWEDFRNAPTEAGHSELFGARVDTTGAVLDPTGLVISVRGGDQRGPRIAAENGNFFVVWSDVGGIWGARVTTAGTLLDADGVYLDAFSPTPAIDGAGSLALLTWSEGSLGIRARRFHDAVPLDLSHLQVSTIPVQRFGHATAAGSDAMLVTWLEGRESFTWSNLVATRVAFDGTILSPERITIPGGTFRNFGEGSAVAYGDGVWLVAWSTRPSGDGEIRGARIASDGTVLDPDGFLISAPSTASPTALGAPGIAYDGSRWLVAWLSLEDGRVSVAVRAARIDGTGTVLDPAGAVVATHPWGMGTENRVAVAAGNESFLVSWVRIANSSVDMPVLAARVGPTGQVLDPGGFVLTPSGHDGFYSGGPSATHDGHRWLVAWNEGVGTSAVRVSEAGSVLDPDPIVLRPATSRQSLGCVTRAEHGFAAFFRDGVTLNAVPRDIYGETISSGGVVVDDAPFLAARVDDWPSATEVACATAQNGTVLVTYQANRPASFGIRGRFVAPLEGPGEGGSGGGAGESAGATGGIGNAGGRSSGGASSGEAGNDGSDATGGSGGRGSGGRGGSSGSDDGGTLGQAGDQGASGDTGERGGTSSGGSTTGGASGEAGAGADAPRGAPETSGCSCSLPGTPRGTGALSWLGFLAGMVALRILARRSAASSPGPWRPWR